MSMACTIHFRVKYPQAVVGGESVSIRGPKVHGGKTMPSEGVPSGPIYAGLKPVTHNPGRAGTQTRKGVQTSYGPQNWLLHADRAPWGGNMRALYPPGRFPFLPPRAKETSKWHPRMDGGVGAICTREAHTVSCPLSPITIA
jgi:hypothetical protein